MYLIGLTVAPVMAPAQPISCSQSNMIQIDSPNTSSSGKHRKTFVYNINNSGEVVGRYVNNGSPPPNEPYESLSFLRTSDGTFASFGLPDQIVALGLGSLAIALNDAGVIAGWYEDRNIVYHGYVRGLDGTLTPFDAPGAGTGPNEGTFPYNINPEGTTTGYYIDSGYSAHGFVRTKQGAFTSFDPVGSVSTYVCGYNCLNTAGATTGYYQDPNTNYHSFVRAHNGAITVFDVPGADTSGNDGTFGTSINPEGTIVGYYGDQNQVGHGFVRTSDSQFTIFDVPGAGSTPGASQGTYPVSINAAGTIAGQFVDTNNVTHGFARSPQGAITTIDIPAGGIGISPQSINSSGAVAGYWTSADLGVHGFVWTPGCGQ
jgi:hypothetical protein